jgi:hypothetical protein
MFLENLLLIYYPEKNVSVIIDTPYGNGETFEKLCKKILSKYQIETDFQENGTSAFGGMN